MQEPYSSGSRDVTIPCISKGGHPSVSSWRQETSWSALNFRPIHPGYQSEYSYQTLQGVILWNSLSTLPISMLQVLWRLRIFTSMHLGRLLAYTGERASSSHTILSSKATHTHSPSLSSSGNLDTFNHFIFTRSHFADLLPVKIASSYSLVDHRIHHWPSHAICRTTSKPVHLHFKVEVLYYQLNVSRATIICSTPLTHEHHSQSGCTSASSFSFG